MNGAAPVLHFLRTDDRLRLPVAAFHQHLGFRGEDERERRLFLEPGDERHGLQRGGDGEPVFERVDRPVRSFTKFPGRGVGIEREQQARAQRARLREVGDVPAVEDVEHAVGEHQRPHQAGNARGEVLRTADFALKRVAGNGVSRES
ncbi:hypothetical protein D3C83_24270 [compost metagenome]